MQSQLRQAPRSEQKEALLRAAEEFFRRKGMPKPHQGIYGAYATLKAERGEFDELNRCFQSIAPGAKDRSRPESTKADDYHFDLLIAFLHLYFKFHDALRPESVQRLKEALKEACAPPGRIYRYDFSFSNTNHPFKCATIQVLAGEILQDEDVRLSGVEKLRSLSRKLAVGVGRPYANAGYSGCVSEFNSPTYAAPQLIPAALLANWSTDAETRAWGILYQELMLMDTLSHWHPPTQQSAAPHSRSYMENTIGGTGLLKYILHAILPGGVFFDTETAWWANHAGDIANAVHAASVDFYAPERLVRLAIEKAYPYTLKMRSSTYGYVYGLWSMPSGPVDTYCYQTGSYSLGSASRPTGTGGQMDAPALKWAKRSPVRSMNDHKVAFFRYREGSSYTFRQASLQDQGIKNVLQHEGSALALYRPRPFAGQADALTLEICIPAWDPVDAIYLGDRKVDRFPAVSAVGAPILIEDGPIAFAILPLELTDMGRQNAVEIDVREEMLVISLVNYKGEPRTFPAERLLSVQNGVAILVEDESGGKAPPLERLRRRLQSAEVRDELAENIRAVSYRDQVVSLEISLSHLDADPGRRYVNGEPYKPEIFSSPSAATAERGRVVVGDAALETTSATPVRLLADPPLKTYAVYNFYPESASFVLDTPYGKIREERFPTGRTVYRFEDGRWAIDRVSPR